MEFRNITDIELDNAYKIIEDRYYYLINKGITQYPCPYPPKKEYIKLQNKNLNYGLYKDNNLIGIITLTKNQTNTGWNIEDKNYIWISSLYVDMEYRYNNVGYKILDSAIEYMSKQDINKFYLDCNTDFNFLDKYYLNYGFSKVEEKYFEYPKIKFNACLMKLNNG